MAILRLLVFACALVTGARADYECLCAYAVETQIYDQPDFSANNIGYMYEFDCKPSYRGLVAPPGWQLVATEHQVGYVQNSTTVEIQVCQGSIPDEDKVTTTFAPSTQAPTTTTTTTVTTQRPTTQTTTRRLTTPPQTVRIFTTTLKTTPTTPKPTTFRTTHRTTSAPTPQPITTTRLNTTPTTPRPTTSTTTPKPTTTTTTPRPTTTNTTPKPTTTTTTPTTTPRPTTTTTTPRPTTTTTTPRPTTTTTTPRPTTTTTTTTPKPTTTTTTPKPTTTTTTTTPRPTTTTTTTMRPTTTQYIPQCPAAVLRRNQDVSLIYKHRSYCYEFRNKLQDWEHAKMDCQNNGGFLLSIQSQDEQDFVLTMLNRLRKAQPIWLGLHDQVHEEQWQWVSGLTMKYKNWMPGSHHDKYHDFEDCALYIPARRGEWDDVHCTGILFERPASHSWICQYRVV